MKALNIFRFLKPAKAIEQSEGVFTNRADLVLGFYNRENDNSPKECLIELGYHYKNQILKY